MKTILCVLLFIAVSGFLSNTTGEALIASAVGLLCLSLALIRWRLKP